jgi:hypothetical protein
MSCVFFLACFDICSNCVLKIKEICLFFFGGNGMYFLDYFYVTNILVVDLYVLGLGG